MLHMLHPQENVHFIYIKKPYNRAEAISILRCSQQQSYFTTIIETDFLYRNEN